MAIKQVGPVEAAIDALDKSIKDLQLKRAELIAMLPPKPVRERKMVLFNPRTGKEEALGIRKKGHARQKSA